MGCACSLDKDETIFDKMNPNLVKLEVESFDVVRYLIKFKVMNAAEKVLEEIEIIRGKISSKYGEFLIQSGAVCLKKPGIVSGLFGMLYQIARDVPHVQVKFNFSNSILII